MASGVGVDKTKHETILAPWWGESVSVLGDHQTVKLIGEQTNGLFTMVEQNNEASVAVPMHVHTREDELFYVCKGEITFFPDGKEIVGTTRTTVYLPGGVPYGFRVNKKTRSLISVYPAGESMFYKLAALPPGRPIFERWRSRATSMWSSPRIRGQKSPPPAPAESRPPRALDHEGEVAVLRPGACWERGPRETAATRRSEQRRPELNQRLSC